LYLLFFIIKYVHVFLADGLCHFQLSPLSVSSFVNILFVTFRFARSSTSTEVNSYLR
jgi:hypothetical protein